MNLGRKKAAAVAGAVLVGGAALGWLSVNFPVGAQGLLSGAISLPGAEAVLPAGSTVLGPLTSTSTISVNVGLQPANAAQLTQFVNAISTPGNPSYHHYLAKGQFASTFGATTAEIDSVESWASAAGLSAGAVAPNGLSMTVSGSASALSAAFGTTLSSVRLANGSVAFADTTVPKIPNSLGSVISSVIGLNNLDTFSSNAIEDPHVRAADADPRAPQPNDEAQIPDGTACQGAANIAASNSAYTSSQIAGIYALSPLFDQGQVGTGVNIGLLELEPFSANDIATYQSCFELHNKITVEPIDGGPTNAQSGEAALDIEQAIAYAPGATVNVYEGPNTSKGIVDTLTQMATDDTAQVIAITWGACEPQQGSSLIAAEANEYLQMASQGQTVVAAAGDEGSEDCGGSSASVDDPGSQPTVLDVGGTSLTNGVAGSGETAWNNCASSTNHSSCTRVTGNGAGGGGISQAWAMAPWQQQSGSGAFNAYTNGSSCNAPNGSDCREVPDVSANADPHHGYVIYYNGQWTTFGGTSAATPLWAGTIAVADQGCSQPLGMIAPALYSLALTEPADFHNVTGSNNDYTGSLSGLYPATKGYNLATGWGSLDAQNLVPDLAAVGGCRAGSSDGYRMASSDGGLFSYGSGASPFFGSPAGENLNGHIVAIATHDGNGYWMVGSNGGVYGYGDAHYFGSTGNMHLNEPIVGMAATPDGGGYWLVASDGGIFNYGDAKYFGSTGNIHLNSPIVGMAATPDGGGYWLVAADGGVFSFGDANYVGGMGGQRLNAPIVAIAASPSGQGYWLVASDGGIFNFGTAGYYGSAGSEHLNEPIVGMLAAQGGNGYWLVAKDGGIFSYGAAPYYGSTGGVALNSPIVGMAAS